MSAVLKLITLHSYILLCHDWDQKYWGVSRKLQKKKTQKACFNLWFICFSLNERPSDDISFGKTNVLIHILSPLVKLWMVYFPSSILISRVTLTYQFLCTSPVGNNFLSLTGLPFCAFMHFISPFIHIQWQCWEELSGVCCTTTDHSALWYKLRDLKNLSPIHC